MPGNPKIGRPGFFPNDSEGPVPDVFHADANSQKPQQPRFFRIFHAR